MNPSDQQKLLSALTELEKENLEFRLAIDSESGQTIIEGMGELHLEIIIDRMMREYKVAANVGKPQVAYRETIRKNAEAEGKFIRQSGGKGQYGHVKFWIEPNPGKGYEFENDITGGSIPKEYIKPVDAGIKEAMEGGILAGYARHPDIISDVHIPPVSNVDRGSGGWLSAYEFQ